jgi:hypothetical protein
MTTLGPAVLEMMEILVADLLATMDGIPDEDLAHWKPAAAEQGGGEMNTFAALAVHTASAGSWMFYHQVFGDEMTRDREHEFHAVATRDEIAQVYAQWLEGMRQRIGALEEVDLHSRPATIRESRPNANRMHWLLHMIDHTALHLGHLEIQRQLWLAEQAG